jgi:hypothetical protein
MNKSSNQVMWFPEGTFKKTEEERERERTLLKKHNPNGEVMWFPEGTFKEREPSKQNHKVPHICSDDCSFDCSENFALNIIVKFSFGIFSPFLAVAAIRDKNIKARIPGVDPLQKNYLKK